MSQNDDILSLDDERFFVLVPESSDHPSFGVSLDRYFKDTIWSKARSSCIFHRGFMLSPFYAVAFFRLLLSDEKMYTADGSVLNSHYRNLVIDDIFSRREPYRAEFFDASFGKGSNGGLTISYGKFGSDCLVHDVTEPLDDDTLMESSAVLDLAYWLRNPTSQGLPRKDSPGSYLFYHQPIDDAVAWFGAYYGKLCLSGSGNPRSPDPGLGVRVAKIFKV